jgi:beta-ureidopropionase / N-carbamoyl-L-amino-acid hydrolase
VIRATALQERLAGLEGIGTGPEGVDRLAWTEEDARCREWFAEQARRLGLEVEVDPAGNLWACPDREPPWWGVGSHLDSVRSGGRFDGPLGVACGFEIAGAVSAPVAVISFADEEGARFNTPTFGSKALAGRLDLPAVLDRRDRDGTTLGDAMQSAGVAPAGLATAPEWLERLAGFLEIHIDQTTELARAGRPVGIVSALAGRMRVEAEVRGRADHAGATPPAERHDALAAAARLIVTAEELGGVRVTTSRIEAEPNAPTTIASRVRTWVDARAPAIEDVDHWRAALEDSARVLAERGQVEIRLDVASRSEGREFSRQLRRRLAEASGEALGETAPELICFAGHDAGVLAERVPAAMLLVRNFTGVSHSPEETIELEDAVAAARVVERLLAEPA